ncbi:sigma 54-interacting transcriptional regulator [Clostridiaceae bacterium 35-E11]
MSKLLTIQDTTQAIAEAITAAIELKTEIIDNELNIVAGTGRYYKKIGQIEEGGNIHSGEIYGLVISTGKEYIIDDPKDPIYLPVEGELAEVCCPINMNNEIIGAISLVAFDEEEKKRLLNKPHSLLNFTRKMASLLASKVLEVETSNKIKIILEAITEGIISVDNNGIITACNIMAERLVGKSKEELIGRNLKEFWVDSPIMDVIHSGIGYKDNEEIYSVANGMQMHFITTVSPLDLHGENNHHSSKNKCTGAVISFRDITDVRKMVYDMTEKKMSASIGEFLGNSKQIRDLKETALKVANGKSTVLITGESGTGKGLLAKAIHFSSARKDAPFITVNCGAIPENLIESEIFGYDAGAFTGAKKNGKPGKFELANKGTIFLDEIGDLPLHLQVKLLDVIQQQKLVRVGGTREISVDVRIIAATNRNLEKMVADGEFRADLYFRLNVIPLYVPPLRDRKEDILILLEHALDRYNKLLGKQIEGFDSKAMQLLLNYTWPGNIRELENVVEYAVNMENTKIITINSFPPRLRSEPNIQLDILPLDLQRKQLEKRVISNALEKIGYSVEQKRKVAKLLGMSESSLYRKIRELKIER